MVASRQKKTRLICERNGYYATSPELKSRVGSRKKSGSGDAARRSEGNRKNHWKVQQDAEESLPNAMYDKYQRFGKKNAQERE